MRLEMLVETEIKILDGQSSCPFLNELFEKRLEMTIKDFRLHSDDHDNSHLLGIGLYRANVVLSSTHCNALQRTATQCNAMQRTATHCNALQRTATHCNAL